MQNCMLCKLAIRNEYKYVVGQHVSKINQTFEEAMKFCYRHNLSLLYPDDSQNILTKNTNISSIWLNMRKTTFQHLTWIDNSSLGWCSLGCFNTLKFCGSKTANIFFKLFVHVW